MLDRLTIRPQPASVMCACAAWLIRKAPRRCTPITASQSSVAHLEQQVVAGDTGVVDQHDRRPELVGDPGDRGLDGARVGDVDADRERPAAVAA